LIALRAAEAERERLAPVAAGLDLAALNFGYRISGDKVGWKPVRVFDDGRQTFVEFAEGIGSDEMPPIFALNPRGEAELVNYRINGRYLIVDRLLDLAVLRLGVGKAAREVRIRREKARGGRS
jgi:type IV secretion system protein VirB9